MFVLALVLGIFEDIYGRTQYSGDAISYLNVVRAIHGGDWKLALSSYWGLGYPLILSAVTPLFPATASGEWYAIHLVNLLIFVLTFLIFFWLVLTAARASSFAFLLAEERATRLILIGSLAIFLSLELSLDNPSRVGPDMLVSCLVFVASALLLKLNTTPTAWTSLAAGATLGAGFVVKSIFLPITFLFALIAILALRKRLSALRYIALMLITSAIFSVPYIKAMTWSAGHFTWGDSGPLNYAWNVNKLEPGGLWQGWPPQFGTPIHPAKMTHVKPNIYLFDGPFAVTFPVFFNPPYYYQGYRRLFSPKAQIHAIGGNILRLVRFLDLQFILYGLVILWFLSRTQSKQGHWRRLLSLWPLLLLAIAGISVYMLVVLEARYIASFLGILMLVLLFAVVANQVSAPRNDTVPPDIAHRGLRRNAACQCPQHRPRPARPCHP